MEIQDREDDKLTNKKSIFTGIKKLAANKATYYVTGGALGAIGGILSSFSGVGGVELAFIGAAISSTEAAIALSAYSVTKMREATKTTESLAKKIEFQSYIATY